MAVGRDAGVLLATAGTPDAVDATVVLLAAPGDRILTSDPGDVARLAEAADNRAVVIAC
jgi:DNA-binding transcriptional MocR family regulator